MPDMPTHISVMYKDSVDNIMFCKRETVVYTNYVLAGYAAILYACSKYMIWSGIGIALTVFLFVYHIVATLSLQRSIKRARQRLNWIYATYFSEKEREGLRAGGRPVDFLKRFSRDSLIVAGLGVISLASAAIVVALLALASTPDVSAL
jgi:hypothetical protein